MFRYFDVNDAGHSIRCKLYCNDEHKVQKVVLFGHGFGGHMDNKAAERFAARVLSKYRTAAVITFNLPCHGNDVKKKMLLADCDTYIASVLKYVTQRFGTEDVSVYATSFGGYLFLKYIHEHGNPFRKIALRCPAVNMYNVLSGNVIGTDELQKLRKGKDVEVGFDRKIKINSQFLTDLQNADITAWDYLDYAEDILILHGTKDEIVPIDAVRDFADQNLIEFVPIDCADHRFMDPSKMDQAIGSIVEFLNL